MATIWRLKRALEESGKTRSPWYADIHAGLMTRPVKLSPRAVGWPATEVLAVNAARIAGETDDRIKRLVERLHAERAKAGGHQVHLPAPDDNPATQSTLRTPGAQR
jgi:prophage regulatory protein